MGKLTPKGMFLSSKFLFFVIFFLHNITLVSYAAASQDTLLYVVDPMSTKKILPNTTILPTFSDLAKGLSANTIVSLPGNTINIRAARGEFKSASFVIRPIKDLNKVILSVTDLVGRNGTNINKKAVDVRVVKCWYQAGSRSVLKGIKTLTPELLLKDDTLIKVDTTTQTNYLKVRKGNQGDYIDITSSNSLFPDNAEIKHPSNLQPFDVQANTNKQIWLTIHIPENVPSDRYVGTILVEDKTGRLAAVNIALTVLPFDLLPPSIDYGLYYQAVLTKQKVRIQADRKTAEQYKIELKNMKDHGVLYPTLAQNLDDALLGQALNIRKDVGLPTDRLFSTGWYTQSIRNLTGFLQTIAKGKKIINEVGYKDLYIYGKDEVRGAELYAQRPIWQAIHEAGAKVFAAVYAGASEMVGDLLDLPIQNAQGSYKPDDVVKWHKLGKKMFIYANPQVGVEDPEIYRRNYGIPLVCAGYDGVMNFAYQYGSEHVGSSIWNDFDAFGTLKIYRDHVFAYPTSDGVIDTIQWEGFREAINDVRYLTTLAAVEGKFSYRSICDLMKTSANLQLLRETIIDRIISALNTN